jgi:hypothetical protein
MGLRHNFLRKLLQVLRGLNSIVGIVIALNKAELLMNQSIDSLCQPRGWLFFLCKNRGQASLPVLSLKG